MTSKIPYTLFFLLALIFPPVSDAQSILDFNKFYSTLHPGDKLLAGNDSIRFIGMVEGGFYTSRGKTYQLHCSKLTTLYRRPLEKIIIQTDSSDVINEIRFFLPFDTLLDKELEKELGRWKGMWMAVPTGVKIEDIIRSRKWELKNLTVSFKCTRYSANINQNEDFIILGLSAGK